MSTIIVTSRAALDIEEICLYYRLHAPRVEQRFQDALRLALEQIRKMPGVGSTLELKQGPAELIQWFAIKKFKYLVFYRVLDYCIEIVRVLHSSRAWEEIYDVSE